MKVAVRYLDQEDQWIVVGCDERAREFNRFDRKIDAMLYAWKCQEDPKCGVTGVYIHNREGEMTFETLTDV